MFKIILACTDGSSHADEAVRAATDLAVQEHARLHLLHVDEKRFGHRLAGQDVSVVEPEILAKIHAQADEISALDIRCELHIVSARVDHVAERIADTAAENDAELIVIATRGRSALGGLLLGSVTQRLLQISECPVLAIPSGAAIAHGEGHVTAPGQTAGS
jgi:nucleotide-binding universal stress UspA family protein